MFRASIEMKPTRIIFSLIKSFMFLVVKISIVKIKYANAAVQAGMKVNEWLLKVIVVSVRAGLVKIVSM